MINGGFLVKFELDSGFLNKTRLTRFVIESAIVELTFHKPLTVLAREAACTKKAIDSVPSKKVWKNLVNLSDVSTDLKKDDEVLPSWLVIQKVCFDPIVIPRGVSSTLNQMISFFGQFVFKLYIM